MDNPEKLATLDTHDTRYKTSKTKRKHNIRHKTKKTDRHNITEILMKFAFNTITLTLTYNTNTQYNNLVQKKYQAIQTKI